MPLLQFSFVNNMIVLTTNPKHILSKELWQCTPNKILCHQHININNKPTYLGHMLAENISQAKKLLKEYYKSIKAHLSQQQ